MYVYPHSRAKKRNESDRADVPPSFSALFPFLLLLSRLSFRRNMEQCLTGSDIPLVLADCQAIEQCLRKIAGELPPKYGKQGVQLDKRERASYMVRHS